MIQLPNKFEIGEIVYVNGYAGVYKGRVKSITAYIKAPVVYNDPDEITILYSIVNIKQDKVMESYEASMFKTMEEAFA